MESQNLIQNKRTLKEGLKEADFKKVLQLIDYLDVNSSTPAKAKEICGKSASTSWRYLNILTGTGYVVSEGNTNESIYKKCMQ